MRKRVLHKAPLLDWRSPSRDSGKPPMSASFDTSRRLEEDSARERRHRPEKEPQETMWPPPLASSQYRPVSPCSSCASRLLEECGQGVWISHSRWNLL